MSFDPKARTITVSDNGIGMSRDEVITEHRHHRQVRHAGVLREPHRRPVEGRPPDRPVRRGLLLLLHRRRPRDAHHAPRRAARRARACAGSRTAAGEYTVEAVERAERGTEVTLHLREGEDELLNGSRLRDIMRKYSDHILASHRHEEGGVGQGQPGLPHHRRGRDRQPGERAVGAAAERDHRGAVPGVLQARRPRFRGAARLDARAGRGPQGVHRSFSTSRRARRSTCGTASTGAASSSTCGACSSWTTPST